MRQSWKGFFFFFFLDGKMSTTLLLCDEAGFGESLGWLSFEDGVHLLPEEVHALLHDFPKTTCSKHCQSLLYGPPE